MHVARAVSRDAIGPYGFCALSRPNQFSGPAICSVGSGLLVDCGGHLLPSIVLKNTAAAQAESHGDGAIAASVFAYNLVCMLDERAAPSNATRFMTAEVFRWCLEWCDEQLSCCDETFRASALRTSTLSLDDVPTLTALFRGMFLTKPFASTDACAVDMIAAQLVKTVTLTRDWCTGESANLFELHKVLEDTARLRTLKILGSPQEMSRCLEGIFIEKPACIHHLDEQFMEWCQGGRVLLFTQSELLVDKRVQRTKTWRCTKSFSSTREHVEDDVFSVVARACQKLDVRVVISQCVLSMSLQEKLLRVGVLPIERVSADHIDALTHLTGGSPVLLSSQMCNDVEERNTNYVSESSSFLSSMWSESLGVCGEITSVKLGSERYIIFRPPSDEYVVRLMAANGMKQLSTRQRVFTLVLCSPTKMEMNELSLAVHSARKVRCEIFYLNREGFPKNGSPTLVFDFKLRSFTLRTEKS